jgi:hypothetical protein
MSRVLPILIYIELPTINVFHPCATFVEPILTYHYHPQNGNLFIYSFIYMRIHCLVHFFPLPPSPTSASFPSPLHKWWFMLGFILGVVHEYVHMCTQMHVQVCMWAPIFIFTVFETGYNDLQPTVSVSCSIHLHKVFCDMVLICIILTTNKADYVLKYFGTFRFSPVLCFILFCPFCVDCFYRPGDWTWDLTYARQALYC